MTPDGDVAETLAALGYSAAASAEGADVDGDADGESADIDGDADGESADIDGESADIDGESADIDGDVDVESGEYTTYTPAYSIGTTWHLSGGIAIGIAIGIGIGIGTCGGTVATWSLTVAATAAAVGAARHHLRRASPYLGEVALSFIERYVRDHKHKAIGSKTYWIQNTVLLDPNTHLTPI